MLNEIIFIEPWRYNSSMSNVRYLFFFLIILLSFACHKKQELKIIGVIVLNDFDETNISYIVNNIESYYNCTCKLLNPIQIPSNCITTVKTERYRADSIIRYLVSIKPESVDYILGLTNENISNTKRDLNGKVKYPESYFCDISIFGLGFCPGKSCVVSSFNFKNANINLVKARLQKITIHELGHNFGLPHCKNENCVIQDAGETVKILDESDTKLCQKCCKKINNMIR